MLRERTAGPALWHALSKYIPKRANLHRDLTTALRSGRDDKGKGGPSGKSSCWTETPHEREHPHRDLSTALRSGRDDKGKGGASGKSSCWIETFPRESTSTQRSLRCAALRSR